MNKTKLNILIGMIVIIGIIGAVVTADVLSKTNSQIDLSSEKETAILTKVTEINIKAEPMKCDDKYCWSRITQKNLIDTDFRTEKSYCSEYEDKEEMEGEPIKCLKYSDYTATELIKMRDSFVKDKLEVYADALIERNSQSKSITQIDDGGQITNVK